MCGILAGQSFEPFDRERVAEALRTIEHRGPDDLAVRYLDSNHKFLAHARLSIVDVQGGGQPLISPDGSIIAIVNGEFYHHKQLRASFADYAFQTFSDSEILLPLYEKYGFDCLRFLHGEFAFVLYDKKRELWFSARDRMGVRPLQYFAIGGTVLFASEAKALLSLGVTASLNREALWFSQNFQYLPQGDSLFQDVHMLPASHYLVWQAGRLELKEYWTFPEQRTGDSLEQATEKCEHLLKQAVLRRIPEEVNWCAHLSGGIDSSLVSYLASRENNLTNFTVSFTEDPFYDEANVAREVSDSIGSTLITVPVSLRDAFDVLPQAIYHAEGFTINSHLGAKFLLNRSIRERGFKVALTGEGSDEIFMGYSHLKQDFLSQSHLRELEKSYLNGIQLPSGETMDLTLVQDTLGYIPTWVQAKSSIAHKFSKLWHPDFSGQDAVKRFLDESGAKVLHQRYGRLRTSSLLWSRYCLSGSILKILDDSQAMAHSIEGRLPFLDTELMEYAWSLPDQYHFSGSIEKHILRSFAKGKLPERVVDKTKQSFMSPPSQRIMKLPKYKAMVYDCLVNNQFLRDLRIFDERALLSALKLWEEDTQVNLEPVFMTVLSIGIFCEQFKIR